MNLFFFSRKQRFLPILPRLFVNGSQNNAVGCCVSRQTLNSDSGQRVGVQGSLSGRTDVHHALPDYGVALGGGPATTRGEPNESCSLLAVVIEYI